MKWPDAIIPEGGNDIERARFKRELIQSVNRAVEALNAPSNLHLPCPQNGCERAGRNDPSVPPCGPECSA
jgi:hypothetical protein